MLIFCESHIHYILMDTTDVPSVIRPRPRISHNGQYIRKRPPSLSSDAHVVVPQEAPNQTLTYKQNKKAKLINTTTSTTSPPPYFIACQVVAVCLACWLAARIWSGMSLVAICTNFMQHHRTMLRTTRDRHRHLVDAAFVLAFARPLACFWLAEAMTLALPSLLYMVGLFLGTRRDQDRLSELLLLEPPLFSNSHHQQVDFGNLYKVVQAKQSFLTLPRRIKQKSFWRSMAFRVRAKRSVFKLPVLLVLGVGCYLMMVTCASSWVALIVLVVW